MGVYEFKLIKRHGINNEFSVEGEIVEVYDGSPYNSEFFALVRKPESEQYNEEPPTEFSETVDPKCIGKDGDCSRTVDEQGDTCWQHEK